MAPSSPQPGTSTGKPMRYHITPKGCWKWGGGKIVDLKPGGQRMGYAARVWRTFRGGDINVPPYLRSTCGDFDCLNPEHLEEVVLHSAYVCTD
jgi:hypothetical protein